MDGGMLRRWGKGSGMGWGGGEEAQQLAAPLPSAHTPPVIIPGRRSSQPRLMKVK